MYLVADAAEIKKDREVFENRWDKMVKEAQKIKPNISSPVIPYKEDHIVGKFNGLDNGNVVIME